MSLAAKQRTHRPSIFRTAGLRARSDVFEIIAWTAFEMEIPVVSLPTFIRPLISRALFKRFVSHAIMPRHFPYGLCRTIVPCAQDIWSKTSMTCAVFVCSVIASLLTSSPVCAGPLISTGFGLGATGSDGVSFTVDGPMSYSQRLEAEYDWYGNGGVIGKYSAEGTIRSAYGNIGLELKASATVNSGGIERAWGGASAFARFQVQDSVTFVWDKEGQIPDLPLGGAILNFGLHGEAKTSIFRADPISSNIQSRASISAWVGIEGFSLTLAQDSVFNPTDNDVSLTPKLQYTRSIESDHTLPFSYGASAEVSTTYGLAWELSFNSFKLESVTFADGTTPESHGWTLVFDSGMVSPNVTDPVGVPEPSSIVLLGLGSIGVIVFRRRYRWRRL